MNKIKIVKIDVLILLIGIAECISFILYSGNENISRPVLMLAIVCLYMFVRLNFNVIQCVNLLKILFGASVVITLIYLIHLYSFWGTPYINENPNYLGIYIALHLPIGFSLIWDYFNKIDVRGNIDKKVICFLLMILVCGYMCVAIMTHCRTAIFSVLFSLFLFTFFTFKNLSNNLSAILFKKNIHKYRIHILIAFIIAILLIIGIGYQLFVFKQYSIIGRILIWKIAFKIFIGNFIAGIGCSQFGSHFCFYEHLYFLEETAKPIERIVATNVHNSFNVYLERIVEMGILGFIIYILFWKEIAVYIYKSFKNSCFPASCVKNNCKRAYIFGAVCSVLAFHIMAITYFVDVLPETALPYSACLACLVTFNQDNYQLERTKSRYFPCFISKRKANIILIFILLPLIIMFSALSNQRHNDIFLSKKIQQLINQHKTNEVGELCCQLLEQSKNFNILYHCGDILMQNKDYLNAKKAYIKAFSIYLDPYVLEQSGLAQLKLEKLDNASVFSKNNKNILMVLENWKIASVIIPWRLTPKYYLADLYYQLSDTSNAIKYARLVVNTPMKKWTERGKVFKLKSQKMLIELGEKCDDPGLIVFDINDKKTWNEGLW